MNSDTTINRFITAQAANYNDALAEIQNGKKTTHWMWYVFPQISGLGNSETAKYYALKNVAEAEEYFAHPVLGKRLIEISTALLQLQSNNAYQILGSPDDAKLKSSMTLFASLKHSDPVFKQVLEKLYDGEQDEKTLNLIQQNIL